MILLTVLIFLTVVAILGILFGIIFSKSSITGFSTKFLGLTIFFGWAVCGTTVGIKTEYEKINDVQIIKTNSLVTAVWKEHIAVWKDAWHYSMIDSNTIWLYEKNYNLYGKMCHSTIVPKLEKQIKVEK